MKTTIINTIELKSLFEKIMNYYDDNNITELKIEYSYYWSINTEQKYNVDSMPSSFTLGDIDFELALLREATKENTIGYELKWFAAIIAAAVDTNFRIDFSDPSQSTVE